MQSHYQVSWLHTGTEPLQTLLNLHAPSWAFSNQNQSQQFFLSVSHEDLTSPQFRVLCYISPEREMLALALGLALFLFILLFCQLPIHCICLLQIPRTFVSKNWGLKALLPSHIPLCKTLELNHLATFSGVVNRAMLYLYHLV